MGFFDFFRRKKNKAAQVQDKTAVTDPQSAITAVRETDSVTQQEPATAEVSVPVPAASEPGAAPIQEAPAPSVEAEFHFPEELLDDRFIPPEPEVFIPEEIDWSFENYEEEDPQEEPQADPIPNTAEESSEAAEDPNAPIRLILAPNPASKAFEILPLVRRYPGKSGIVFCRNEWTAENICGGLRRGGVNAVKFSSAMTTEQQDQALEQFDSHQASVLIVVGTETPNFHSDDVAYLVHCSMPESAAVRDARIALASKNNKPKAELLMYTAAEYLLYQQEITVSGAENKQQQQKQLDAIRNIALGLTPAEESVQIPEAENAASDISTGICNQTFVITGKINRFPSRSMLEDFIRSQGGKIGSAISKSTAYLITNDTGSGSRKNRMAAEFGTRVFSEQDFLNLFCGGHLPGYTPVQGPAEPSCIFEEASAVSEAAAPNAEEAPATMDAPNIEMEADSVAIEAPVIEEAPAVQGEIPAVQESPLTEVPEQPYIADTLPAFVTRLGEIPLLEVAEDLYREVPAVMVGVTDPESTVIALLMKQGEIRELKTGRKKETPDGKKHGIQTMPDPTTGEPTLFCTVFAQTYIKRLVYVLLSRNSQWISGLEEAKFPERYLDRLFNGKLEQLGKAAEKAADSESATPGNKAGRKPKNDSASDSAQPAKKPGRPPQKEPELELTESSFRNIIGFDLETPNTHNDRISQIGITYHTPYGKISRGILINPETHFDPINTRLTGISARDVAGKPNFREAWNSLEPMVAGSLLVIHSAKFDISVLRKAMHAYGITPPEFWYVCTQRIGTQYHPEMVNQKLDTLCNQYGITLSHHDAGSDSNGCYELFRRFQSEGLPVFQKVQKFTL